MEKEEVLRWHNGCAFSHGHKLSRNPKGGFVAYEDYKQLLSALEASQREAEELKKILKDAPTHEDMDAVIFQASALLKDIAVLRGEVREWLCVRCDTVYPGPPAKGVWCIVCPKCSGDCGPRGLVERRALKVEMDRLRKLLKLVQAAYCGVGDLEGTGERMVVIMPQIDQALARTEKAEGSSDGQEV